MCFKMFIKLYGKGLVDIIFEGNWTKWGAIWSEIIQKFQICTSAQWKFDLKSENLIAQKQDLCQWKYLTFAFQKL